MTLSSDSLVKRDQQIYRLVKQYITHNLLMPYGFGEHDLEKYLVPDASIRNLPLAETFERLLHSAKNKKTSGKGAIESVFGSSTMTASAEKKNRWAQFRAFLYDFNVSDIVERWDSFITLLPALQEEFQISIFTQPVILYCKSIISGARFLAGFGDASGFYSHRTFA